MKRIKGFTAILLTLLLTLVIIAPVMAEPMRDDIVGKTQQGPNWHYMVRVDDGDWQYLHHTPDWGDNWQYSTNPMGDQIFFSVFEDWGLFQAFVGFNDDRRFDLALRYDVTEAGSVYIEPWRHVFTADGGDIRWHNVDGEYSWLVMNLNESGIVTATIMHNDEVLYSGTSSTTEITGSEMIPLEVAVGDSVWFIVEPGEGAHGNVLIHDLSVSRDNDFWQPEIELRLPQDFGGNGVFSLRDMYMGNTQHGPYWYFLSRYGDGDWQEMTFWDEWGGNNWQYTTNPHYYDIWFSMFDWNGVSAATGFDILTQTPVEMAAAFRAPQSGTLRIGPWQHIDFGYTWWDGDTIVLEPNDGANPSAVEIRHNDETIYFQNLYGGFQSSPELSVDVEEGDRIYFIVRPMELENFEAGETRVRMDDILLTFDPGVNFADNIARMPQLRAEAPQPGDQVQEPVYEPEPEPADDPEPDTAEEPTPAPEPTPEPEDDSDDGFPIWAIILIAAGALAVVCVIVVMSRKKKQG